MPLHELNEQERYACLHAATFEHFRTSLGLDGNERVRLQHEPLDANAVRRIAKEYMFIQWIPRDPDHDADVNADGVAQIVNQALPNWPPGLDARRQFCADLATEAHNAGCTVNRQMSGMTKLLWFVRPNGWTIYDSFAAAGAGVGGGNTITRASNFYQNLDARGFDGFVAEISATLAQHQFDTLFGERIVDKLLMLAGGAGQGGAPLIQGMETFPEFIPEAFRDPLEQLCNDVAGTFWNHPFFNQP